MATSNELTKLLLEVRKYDAENSTLQESHHFLFCKQIDRGLESSNAIVMGFNPGETAGDWKSTDGKRSEETFEYDFHAKNRTASSKRWMSNIDFFLPNHNVYLTELFFWSTHNVGTLESRHGKISSSNPHIKFCKQINIELFRILQPKIIVFVGLTRHQVVADIYDLRITEEYMSNEHKKLYFTADSTSCPWIFSRHWSGSFGFSNSDKKIIKDRVSELANKD